MICPKKEGACTQMPFLMIFFSLSWFSLSFSLLFVFSDTTQNGMDSVTLMLLKKDNSLLMFKHTETGWELCES